MKRCLVVNILNMILTFAAFGTSLPQGWETYFDRPNILKVKEKAHQLGTVWQSMKPAHFSFIAELLTIYGSDTHLYFLARDAELLYDLAKLVTEGTPDYHRIHLLNISRGNMRDTNLKNYLLENGISEREIIRGKKILFIDTGFSGTIPRVVGESFSNEAKAKLRTHLIVSNNSNFPSSRAFLIHLNPTVNEGPIASLHGTIINYEQLPKYTDRSSKYYFFQGRYHPVSPVPIDQKGSDGLVSKQASVRFMEDLKHEWSMPQVRARFEKEKSQFLMIKTLIEEGGEQSIKSIKALLDSNNGESRQAIEAKIRDIFEMQINTQVPYKLSLEDIGLKPNPVPSESPDYKKNELIIKYPLLAPILENPEEKIPELFKQKNWQMIGSLIDLSVDTEINNLIAKYLFDGSAQGIQKSLQNLVIKSGRTETLSFLVEKVFSTPKALGMQDLLNLMIQYGTASVLRSVAIHVFSEPHSVQLQDSLRLLIETSASKQVRSVMNKLALHAFSRPHAKGLKVLLKLAIESATYSEKEDYIRYVFSQPHAKGLKDIIHNMILNGGSVHLFASYVFSEPHTASMIEELKSLVIYAGTNDIEKLKAYVFTKPHAQTPYHKILKQALEYENHDLRRSFIDEGFSKINSQLNGFSKYSVGQALTLGGRSFEIVRIVGSGKRGVVYQVRGENGADYALKVAINQEPETVKSISQESEKAKKWQALMIPHAKVLYQDNTMVLKTWIVGMSGEDVMKKFFSGDVSYASAVQALIVLVEKVISKGAYIGDFRPSNLIWTGKSWIIVDSGDIHQGMSYLEARHKWESFDQRGQKFKRRWNLDLPPPVCSQLF